ncbi:MAG: hypothetical protein JRJ27_07145 [Deltaproteobacteria bacterium]|nr:hypothetical protein [Deltaproteobacteria bacterium]
MLLDIPAIIKVVFVFILVLFLIRKKISLGNAFLVGALSLSVLFGLKPGPIIDSVYKSVSYPKTYLLAIIVSLILILSSSMEKSDLDYKRIYVRINSVLRITGFDIYGNFAGRCIPGFCWLL